MTSDPVARASTAVTSCAFRAQLRGDPLLGTAFPAGRLLLVEQAGPWGRRGLRDSRFPSEVSATLEARANAAGIRVQAVRRPGRVTASVANTWALADTRRGSEAVRWGTFTEAAELLDLPFDGSVGEVRPGPVYLVCAHGGHDPCCAVRGRSVADALVGLRPGQVWETTHLGGDRFAANVLVLPSGLLYGRVLTGALPEFVGAADNDTVLTALLRGQVGLPPATQAAVAFAHDKLSLRRRSDVRPTGSRTPEPGRTVVALTTAAGPREVEVQQVRVDADGLTCSNPGANAYLEQRPVSIRDPNGSVT